MPSVAQPIMALVLPLMRSLDAKILKTQLTKCRIVDDLVVEAYACIISNVNFLLYVISDVVKSAFVAHHPKFYFRRLIATKFDLLRELILHLFHFKSVAPPMHW